MCNIKHSYIFIPCQYGNNFLNSPLQNESGVILQRAVHHEKLIGQWVGGWLGVTTYWQDGQCRKDKREQSMDRRDKYRGTAWEWMGKRDWRTRECSGWKLLESYEKLGNGIMLMRNDVRERLTIWVDTYFHLMIFDH